MNLNTQILIAAILGVAFGFLLIAYPQTLFFDYSLYGLGILSSIFIGLLKMLLIPLIFSSIVVGVSNLQAGGQFGRVWKITVLCCFTTTTLALILGIGCAHLFEVGKGIDISLFQAEIQNHQTPDTLTPSSFFTNFIQNTLINPFKAFSEGNVLAVVLFALFIGAALVKGGESFAQVRKLSQQFFNIMMLLVSWVMRLAPIGIFALLAKLIAIEDLSVLSRLAEFAVVVTGTTIFHGVVVLPALLWIFGKMNPMTFFRGTRTALVTAFATSSSSATMPLSMQCAQENLGVRPQTAGFVIPLGTQLNMDGTALYEAAAALFIANLMGLDLSLTQQIIVCLTAMIASLGAPGIPSAGMVTMIMVLQSVGLPAEAIAILLPIDRVLDTVRTVVNVQGDMMISVVVDRYAKQAEAESS
ncbi:MULTISPECIES: dicarboxylate/amino acid:cation symporter [unclassified Acinetobacter]|uniref:dicarboxylate/amino acid:cation symporter n=1 Tax=unclassified Acinetobacter TaxID=196816 RepID=UPI00244B1C5F|nr:MULTISPECIES: dicarboxylate/amino acid:cation symporter [unclassified Acinetobacter]MDH0029750.1 dicarboxylate/amino acid:cation symporter [Acinetobacter sp. GD04021]MDH0885486.1 dicarboxylate/amino acid:cation symporter [Acinetobacter sp. GD03873]MDH1081604.1 dicarboxylate/amino acid:cation symporter [Acinetobacter sp. GD03983]MDH2188615.1 dicarboxylate/amino acid:cation symporter [Acinetobacter sp. GD03645]MDH2203969.1 dicarboxylate/amino acid:cation symporter [Acinetobacter sp. GD03647]